MKKITLPVLFALFAIQINAQTSINLNAVGNIIGTAESVDYANDSQPSYTVNTKANCFDGDFSTYFATFPRNGWAGLDLGQKYVITEVKWCPRDGQPNDRLLTAVFEGANRADFSDAIPLHVIANNSPANQLSSATVNSSKGYRYVRYVGRRDSRCNVAELEFWGYLSAGNNSHVGQVTNLPTVSIHTINNQIINSKENYIKGFVTIINGSYVYTDSLEIRGRGNASWDMTVSGYDYVTNKNNQPLKKPYRMKLFNKTKLLGNPANEKNWTLINNWGDKTLIRNLLAFDLSKRTEMAYTPAGQLVDVVLNGEYQGTYQLCDHIQVAPERVDVDELKKTVTTLPDLSGGYLVEVDAYAYTEDIWFHSAQKGIPVTIKSPDNNIAEQNNYIIGHFNAMENALFGSGYANLAGGFRKYTDVPSLIRHFLVGEISGNTDTYWSVYMYKKRGDDKFYFGPVWDFDIAFDNDYRMHPIKPDWIYKNGSSAGDFKQYVNRWLSDANLYNELKTTYAQYRDNGKLNPDTLLAVIDKYAVQINASQDLNFKCWGTLDKWVHMNWGVQGSYAGEVTVVKDYLRGRIAWLDDKLDYVPAPVNSVNKPEFQNISIFSTDNQLNISNLSELTKISCYDVLGKIIFEQFAENSFSKTLPQGIYLVRLTKQDGASQTFKCVVR
ncbi:MAG: CotH kinase family protein [Prevotellaceae bacterium]|jgi:hypothetical protein|nr:CotH kinase family protein [Prevotellaceae bacterium]